MKNLGTDDLGIKNESEDLGFKVIIKNNSGNDDIGDWV